MADKKEPFVPDEIEDDTNPEPDVTEPDEVEGEVEGEVVPPAGHVDTRQFSILPAAGHLSVEPAKPRIVEMFKELGIVKGALIDSIMLEHFRLENVRVESVTACLDPFEIILTVKEDGVSRGGRHLVRWSKVAALTIG